MAYGAALAMYTVGHTMHRCFAARRPGWRPGKQRAFAMCRRRWSLRCHRLSIMRMKLDGVGLRQLPTELQRGKNIGEPSLPMSQIERSNADDLG